MQCMSRRAAVLLLLLIPCASLFPVDEVTHAHITDLAMKMVRDPALSALLSQSSGIVRFGSRFPDWGQYNHHPFAEMNHWQTPFLYAFMSHLMEPGVRESADYPRLVALFMGASAHSLEDQYYDSLFMDYLETRDLHALNLDVDMGMAAIRGNGYLGVSVTPFIPDADLVSIYGSINAFSTPKADESAFPSDIRQGMLVQDVELRGLKLLSLLAAGRVGAALPWGSTHVQTAPGGHEDTARVVARHWESLWQRIQGGSPELVTSSWPVEQGVIASTSPVTPYGSVVLVSWRELSARRMTGAARLVAEDGSTVGVRAVQRNPDRGMNVVRFIPRAALSPGKDYRFELDPGAYGFSGERLDARFVLHFSAPAGGQSETLDAAADAGQGAARGFDGMGLFLFLIIGSVGAFVAGLPSLIALARVGRTGTAPGRVTLVIQAVFCVIGVALIGVGVWLLCTGGAAFTDLIRSSF